MLNENDSLPARPSVSYEFLITSINIYIASKARVTYSYIPSNKIRGFITIPICK